MITLDFSPLFPWTLLAVLTFLTALLLCYGVLKHARGIAWRSVALFGILLALANPIAIERDRDVKPDILTVVVDNSTSQQIGDRSAVAEEALAHIEKSIPNLRNIELRTVRAGAANSTHGPVDGTRLFKALEKATADIPQSRMAGTIFITDGQVHDIPEPSGKKDVAPPVHVLLTGKRKEFDRRIVVRQVPKYGIVDKEVELTIRIEDTQASQGNVPVSLVQDGGPPKHFSAPIGRDHTVKVRLGHAGANILQMEVTGIPGELTPINNRAVVSINGVRERLRVLLVSGEPHPGERIWRNLLKADPSVDLVHFTILRPPEKQDMTPVRELSLIAFPIRELFEVKLNDFDLIIFDRYRRRGVLPSIYIDNIARYVENGGAILEAAGPEFAGNETLYQSPLGRVLPGEPTGVVMTGGLRAKLTETGQRHSVTADLPGAGIGEELPRWGRWFRQVEVIKRAGRILMSGTAGKPILIVNRVQKGRVAQLMSDHIWLWARGLGGGGPHAELLRRLAHWLMKEPELEENALRAQLEGNKLAITRRSVDPDKSPVEVTTPSGEKKTVTLMPGIGGRAKALISVSETGIYKVTDRNRTALAAVGNLNPLEFSDMRTTGEKFRALSEATGGGIIWMADGAPDLRRVKRERASAGRDWFGLVDNQNFTVKSVREVPLLPGLVILLLALGTLLMAWRAEGR
ncbi:MAG: hypothetical protein CMM52_11760 [Rhodospirillaceae bacterium]|nr:hypothetical protein [Rhodospirillaceae bacterium]|tara:strand:+ start:7452 stop:9518 length:2067 start_codon:yes stop_codon:yes gene_type:complete